MIAVAGSVETEISVCFDGLNRIGTGVCAWAILVKRSKHAKQNNRFMLPRSNSRWKHRFERDFRQREERKSLRRLPSTNNQYPVLQPVRQIRRFANLVAARILPLGFGIGQRRSAQLRGSGSRQDNDYLQSPPFLV